MDEQHSALLTGSLIGGVAFALSLLLPWLMYLPWTIAVAITGEPGAPTNANLSLTLVVLAIQSAAIGYVGARIHAWMGRERRDHRMPGNEHS